MIFNKSSCVLAFGCFFFNAFAMANPCDEINVPIVFDQKGMPTIELEINGQPHFALLDLGSSGGLHLSAEKVRYLSGVKYTGNTHRSTNVAGEEFLSKAFIVSAFQLKCFKFENVPGQELDDWSVSLGEKPEGVAERKAILGFGFFKDKTITIDYASSNLNIKNNRVKTVSSEAKSLAMNSASRPYSLSVEGISIPVESDIQSYQMVLDTGASHSVFSASKVNRKEPLTSCNYKLGQDSQGKALECQSYTAPLSIAGHPFSSNLLLYPIIARFKQDGLLGGDFFHQFVVQLNFASQSIAITPNATVK